MVFDDAENRDRLVEKEEVMPVIRTVNFVGEPRFYDQLLLRIFAVRLYEFQRLIVGQIAVGVEISVKYVTVTFVAVENPTDVFF